MIAWGVRGQVEQSGTVQLWSFADLKVPVFSEQAWAEKSILKFIKLARVGNPQSRKAAWNRHTCGAIERLLIHPDSDVRLAALEQMPPLFNQPEDRRRLDIVIRLERDDPDLKVRALATQRLGLDGNQLLNH